jgi:nitrogen fixation protein FixH
MTTITHSRNPWPAAIVGSFVVFISGVVIFIAWAVRQDMDLVRKDYYEDEIRFQESIASLGRTRPLHSEVAVTYDAVRALVGIALPASHGSQRATGRIRFYRPSDARLDHEVTLAVRSDGTQSVDAKRLRPGLWKVHLLWKANGEDYTFVQPLVIELKRS